MVHKKAPNKQIKTQKKPNN